MFCTQCGTELPDDSRFCRKCGKPLTATATTTTNISRTAARAHNVVASSSSAKTRAVAGESKLWGRFTEIGWSVAVLLFIMFVCSVIIVVCSSDSFTGSPASTSSAGLVTSTNPANSNTASAAVPVTQPKVDTPNEVPKQARKPDEYEGARLAYAELLQTIYKKEGRMIIVRATGAKHDVLELSSPLIMEGNHTLDAARRETVRCLECMEIMKHAGFKTLLITGTRFGESWNVADF